MKPINILDSYQNIFIGFMGGFIIGGILMARSHGTLFKSWSETPFLEHGDKVEYRYKDDFYSKCKDMTVIDTQAISNDNLVWVLFHKCDIDENDYWTDTFSNKDLIKIYK